MWGYTYTPVYKTLSDLIVVKPITDNNLASGAYVHFLASDEESDVNRSFTAMHDDDGYAIIDRFTRVVDNNKDSDG